MYLDQKYDDYPNMNTCHEFFVYLYKAKLSKVEHKKTIIIKIHIHNIRRSTILDINEIENIYTLCFILHR